MELDLTDMGCVRRLMTEHGLSFKKKFGQNFLISRTALTRIAEQAGGEGVLEIGPGIGSLTRELCRTCRRVAAVEIDGDLLPVLDETLGEFDNVTVIHGDVMKVDLPALVREQFGTMPVAVCANLPYYITTPILMLLLESGIPFTSITVMVQKEVAVRLTAAPGDGEYGAVTAAVNWYGSVRRLMTVPAGQFLPPPKVDSAVVRVDLYDTPPCAVKDPDLLFRVIRGAFGQRRKTLVNALSGAFPITKDRLCDAVTACGFDAGVRGETLSVCDFARLADELLLLL